MFDVANELLKGVDDLADMMCWYLAQEMLRVNEWDSRNNIV